jgi:hypothetical protein
VGAYGKFITSYFSQRTQPYMAVLPRMAGCLDGLPFLPTLYLILSFKISLLSFDHELPFSGTLFASEVVFNQTGAG